MQFSTLFIAHIQPMTVFGASFTLVVRIGIGHWRSELVNVAKDIFAWSFFARDLKMDVK